MSARLDRAPGRDYLMAAGINYMTGAEMSFSSALAWQRELVVHEEVGLLEAARWPTPLPPRRADASAGGMPCATSPARRFSARRHALGRQDFRLVDDTTFRHSCLFNVRLSATPVEYR